MQTTMSMMTSIRVRWPALLVAGALAGCSDSANPVPERYPADEAAAMAMESYDANQDGKIDGPELDKCLALKYSVVTSGGVTADEIAQRMQSYAEGSTHIATVIQVMSNGRPVEGAVVTLNLEPFMGAELPTYTATMDDQGTAAPQSTDSDEPLLGIPPGFYSVTISAPGQAGEIIRGCEVADDAPTANRLAFSLENEAPLAGGGRGGR